MLDPVQGSPSLHKDVVGVICVHVDDLFMAGNKEFHKNVVEIIKQYFEVGSGDCNDIMFVGRRIRWTDTNIAKPYIRVDQDLCIDELKDIDLPKGLADSTACSPQHQLFAVFLIISIGSSLVRSTMYATSSHAAHLAHLLQHILTFVLSTSVLGT